MVEKNRIVWATGNATLYVARLPQSVEHLTAGQEVAGGLKITEN